MARFSVVWRKIGSSGFRCLIRNLWVLKRIVLALSDCAPSLPAGKAIVSLCPNARLFFGGGGGRLRPAVRSGPASAETHFMLELSPRKQEKHASLCGKSIPRTDYYSQWVEKYLRPVYVGSCAPRVCRNARFLLVAFVAAAVREGRSKERRLGMVRCGTNERPQLYAIAFLT